MREDSEYTIDQLARAAETTVRSVRVYHERGLLPSPELRGRIGFYGPQHLHRLQTISRLLGRGMRLNGIRELFEAWDRGDGLGDVLGVPDSPLPPATETGTPATEPVPPPVPPNRFAASRRGDLTDRLVEKGTDPAEAHRLVERLAADCVALADRHATELLRRLTGFADGRSPDRFDREADLAVARMVTTWTVTEIVDQAFGRYCGPLADHPQPTAVPNLPPAASLDRQHTPDRC